MSLVSAGEPYELPQNYRSGDPVAGRWVPCAFFTQREGYPGFAVGSQHNQRALSLLPYQGDILSAKARERHPQIVLIVLVGKRAHGTHKFPCSMRALVLEVSKNKAMISDI